MSQPESPSGHRGELAPLALRQLAAWRAYAAKWCYRLELRRTDETHRIPNAEQYHLVCVVCDTSVMTLMSEGMAYMLCTETLLDAVTAHVRNVHRDQEVNAYGKDEKAFAYSRGLGADSRNNSHPG